MNSNLEKNVDKIETKANGIVRDAMNKAGAAAGHLVEQAGERVHQAGEMVGEAAINVGVRFEQAGDKLKAAGKKMSNP